MHRIWKIFILALLGLLIISCGSNSQAPVTPTLPGEPTLTSSTVPATLTASPVPATETYTPVPPTDTPVPTATFSPTPTPIPSDTATPTEEPPMAGIYAHSVCRFGPSTAFTIHTYFEEDGSALVRGRLEDDSWLLIELPEGGETCWIFREIVDLDKAVAMMPVLTPPPKPTPAPVPTKSEEERAKGVKYFLIIPDNGGPFACGDGLVYFYTGQKTGGSIEDEVKAALNALFSIKTEYVGTYYNPVYKSSLRVRDVELNDGHLTVWLSGSFVKAKTECEAKRIHLQVWETARQFSKVEHRPVIWVNKRLLGDLLEGVQK